MPSLVDFKPLLDTYNPNAGQEDIRQGMKEAAHYAAKSIDDAGERGRQREKEFQSVFDMDVSKVTDMESKNYLISEYGKLKNDYVNKFDKNKNILGYGKLSPREKIELRGDMDSLKSSAATLQILDKSLVEASDPKNKKWGYEVDKEKAKAYSEAKKTGDTAKMASLLQSVGSGFTKISDVDVPVYVMDQVDEARKAMETSKDIVKNQSISGGNTYNTSTAITKFGTAEDASRAIYGVMDNKETGPVLEENLRKGGWLTDKQKREAEKNVGTYNYPLLKYYTDKVMDTTPILEEKKETVKSERPIKKSRGTGVKSKVFEKTELGWDYGTFPILYSGDLNINGESVNVSGAKNIGIDKEDGKYYAKFQVPRDIDKEKREINDKIDKEVAGRIAEETKDISGIKFRQINKIEAKIKKEVNDKYESELSDKSKKKTIRVPLEDVYDELAPKLEYNKMFLKDFNPNWRSESSEQTTKPSKKKDYNLKDVEYTRQELIDAGWTEEDLKRL